MGDCLPFEVGCLGRKKGSVEVAADEIAKAIKALPCHRVLSIPIGLTLITFLFLPAYLFMFFWLGLTKGMCVVWFLFAFNWGKLAEHTRNTFRKAEGFGACCPFFNSYFFPFVFTLILNLLLIPFFLVVYPVYGALHSCKIAAKEAFIECDMAEEARPDKGGVVAYTLDFTGVTDGEKEKCAESVGASCPGYILLVTLDWLTITGVGCGFGAFLEGYEFHDGVLEQLVSLLKGFGAAEQIGWKDWVEFDVVGPSTVCKSLNFAVKMQYDAFAIKKYGQTFFEFSQKSSLKKYRGCFGDFFAVVATTISLIFWAGLPVVIVLYFDEMAAFWEDYYKDL